MQLAGWITVSVIVIVFGLLAFNVGQADALFLGATAFLALVGVISPEEAFAGFANTGMLTVAMMFIVATGLRETGILDQIGQRLLGTAQTERQVFIRLSAIVIPLSAFLNNTPIVAMLCLSSSIGPAASKNLLPAFCSPFRTWRSWEEPSP